MMRIRPNHGVRRMLVAAGFAVFAVLLARLISSGFVEKAWSVDGLRAQIAQAGAFGPAAYFVIQMLTVIFAPLPSNVAMLAGALALGTRRSLPLGICAVLLASMFTFCLARRLGRGAVRRLINRSVMEKYLPLIERNESRFLFLTLLLPCFPDDVICILAGLTSIPFPRYALMVILARPWGLIGAALIGGGEVWLPLWGYVLLGAGAGGVFVVGLLYGARIEAALLRRICRVTRRAASADARGKEGALR